MFGFIKEKKVPRDLRNERHYALDMNDVCCNGSCSQGRTCPRYAEEPERFNWFYSTCLISLIGVMGLALVILT